MNRILIRTACTLLCVLTGMVAYGQNRDSLIRIIRSREVSIDGKITVLDAKTPAEEAPKCIHIPRIHPAAYDSIPAALYEEVASRTRALGKDSLSSADLLWVLRPYLMWMQRLDPHLRVEPQPRFPSYDRKTMKAANNLPAPGFLLLHANDTLVVSRSVDPLFHAGDRILSINGVDASRYLEYCYDDRYIYPFNLLLNYHYELIEAPEFRIGLERGGHPMEFVTPGIPWLQAHSELIRQHEFEARIFSEAKAGYFSIGAFYPNNSLLINRMRKAILQAKKQGCDSFILDLRGNPGGNGSRFDELLSILIDKPSIPYCKGQRLRVSPSVLGDYDFLTDSMIGQLVDLPDRYIHREVKLDRKKYIPMRYYVLMNKDTGSTAATFCNIMQYNGAARLVGEALPPNALKYGEVVNGWFYLTNLYWGSISTVEIDEFTRADDGVLTPDIAIPYVAADYLTGRDAMLDRLLEIIRSESPEGCS